MTSGRHHSCSEIESWIMHTHRQGATTVAVAVASSPAVGGGWKALPSGPPAVVRSPPPARRASAAAPWVGPRRPRRQSRQPPQRRHTCRAPRVRSAAVLQSSASSRRPPPPRRLGLPGRPHPPTRCVCHLPSFFLYFFLIFLSLFCCLVARLSVRVVPATPRRQSAGTHRRRNQLGEAPPIQASRRVWVTVGRGRDFGGGMEP